MRPSGKSSLPPTIPTWGSVVASFIIFSSQPGVGKVSLLRSMMYRPRASRAPSLHACAKPVLSLMLRTRTFLRDCDHAANRLGVLSVEPLSTTITSYAILSGLTDFSIASRQAVVKTERFLTGIMIEQENNSADCDCSTPFESA